MHQIELKYGLQTIPLDYDPERFELLEAQLGGPALTDIEIGQRLDQPIDSDTLEDRVQTGESVLIVVPDITRQVGCGQVVNLIVRRLIANGTPAHDIRIIFATGIHRKVTEAEKAEILTPFIAQRIKTLDHDPRDLARLVRLGETSGGIGVELDRTLVEHDHIVLIGGVTFHYFAGFTGGRKLICPGLASSRTIANTHKLAFDCERLSRRAGVGSGKLDGNPVHEAFVEAASKAPSSFAINTMVDDAGNITDLNCGDWISSHRLACQSYEESNTIYIKEKRPFVIASCGGYPFDVDLIQAHKTLEAASSACEEGGTIILMAECRDGLGRSDLMNWFDAANSRELGKMLCEKYQVNGQTAWSLLRKAERFDVKFVTNLPGEQVGAMQVDKVEHPSISEFLKEESRGYILPAASKIHIKLADA